MYLPQGAWFCVGPLEFLLEFVGDGAVLEIQLAATGRVEGRLEVVIIPVPGGDVATCQQL